MGTFETQQFGNGIAPGTTVGGIESNVTSQVSNHYNARETGGQQGVVKTEGGSNEYVQDFSQAGPLHDSVRIPEGAVVIDVAQYNATGTLAAVVGSQNIVAARLDDDSTWVTITTAADIALTGLTAGKAVVTYRNYATPRS